jgi:UDPglucose 6-dehydrogenase
MSKRLPAISVVGLGKLGSPMVACFASKGFAVVGVDVDEAKVAAIAERHAPVFETGLEELLQQAPGEISATTDVAAAVAETDVTMIIVPTPSDEDGTFSLRYALPACQAVGRALRERDGYHLVVITSTVMPGATGGPLREALEQASGKRAGVDFGLCYSPEFIALGSVIRDFLNPDFLLVGETDERAGDLLSEIYAEVCDRDAPVARMSFVSAELAKISVNTFVTTKIAFANMLARMCERLPGASVDDVTDALGLDTRIGPKYLRGAVSYGGPCFPRDNVAFAALANGIGARAAIAEATDASNRADVDSLAEIVQAWLPEDGSVAVLGLSYKPGTDVVEEAAGVHLARTLAEAGVDVVAHDPAGVPNAQRVLGDAVGFAASAADAVQQADVVVLTTPWPEFAALDPAVFEREGEPRVVVDCWRALDRESLESVATYLVLGEGRPVSADEAPGRGRPGAAAVAAAPAADSR